MATAGTTEESFRDLFLVADDLPGMRQTQDTRMQGPDGNDVFFPRHRGLFAGLTVWQAPTKELIWRVVDIRWSFPREADAFQYQDEATLLNSEGAPELTGLPIVVGDQFRVFGFPKGLRNPLNPKQSLSIPPAFSYHFRVANVVVKLFAAEGPQYAARDALSPFGLKPLADRVTTRITKRLR